MTEQHDHEAEQDDGYEVGGDDLADWEPPKAKPPEHPYVPQQPALARIRRTPVIATAIGVGVLLVGGVGYAAIRGKQPVQERPMKLAKSNEHARTPEAVLAMEAASKKQQQAPTFASSVTAPTDDVPVNPGWREVRARDPREVKCDDLEDTNAVVACHEAKERLEKQYPWAHNVPAQNVRNYNPAAYAANPNRDQENESKYVEPLMTLGIFGQQQPGAGQIGQAQPQLPQASPPPVFAGLSAADAHRMAQGMAGEQDGDQEGQKERFMAQGGIETLGGGSEDVGECDLSAGTPVHASALMATNSDLPAQNTIPFRVNKTVYCGADREHVMLPQGTTFTVSLNQRTSYGDQRQQLCAKQLERPKSAAHPRGDRKQLGCFPIADIQGRTGMEADVDNHWGSVVMGSLLSALLGMGPSALAGNQQGFAPSVVQSGAQQFGQSMNQAGQRVVNRELQRKPTLTTEQLEDVVIIFSSNLQLDPWTPVGTVSVPSRRRVAAW